MSYRRWLVALSLVTSAIVVAVVVLGYYAYRFADQLTVRTEQSMTTSNQVIGRKLIDRIEQLILDNDRTFLKLVNLDDQDELLELWRRIIRLSPVVESLIVLDERAVVRHFVTRLEAGEQRWFRRVLQRKIVPDMGLAKLAPDQHRHLHKSYGGKTYLLSYIRRPSVVQDYYIALSVSIPYLRNEIFAEEFREVEKSRTIAVMDESGRVLYGRPVAAADSKLIFEDRFPTTLYKWRLQVAPLDVVGLHKDARARRLLELAMVIGAVGVIAVGLLVMAVAIRNSRRTNQLKSEFIANVTHELKTPLSLIKMFSELLALGRAENREVTREYAEIITRESDRLTGLIDNVLDFAQIERGRPAYDFAVGNFARVVERVVELAAYRSDQAGVRLVTEIADDLPELAFDESAMTLLLLNLIENALKYGSGDGTEVRVSARVERTRTTRHVVLRVADDGPGIAPDDQRRIFERFYRGKGLRSSIRGSGIGLSLVKHIAEAHGGRVEVRSALGKGATFAVSIPVKSPGARRG